MRFRSGHLAAVFTVFCAPALALPASAAEVIVVQTEVFDEFTNLSIDVDSGLGFNLSPPGEIRCNYLLHGPIERGDLDRLKAAIPSGAARGANETPRLCLNSPGGDYPEGLAIAKWLMQEFIGTAVPAGARCYSSCSLIFMGGTYAWKGELNRFLHVTGDVGFHAPYFTVDSEQPFNGEQISTAFSMGVDGIRQLMALGVGNKVQRFPPELMAEMLAKGKDEVFSIDTVGKAIRFRVHLYGARANPPIDKNAFCNVCINMNYGAAEDYGKGGSNDLCASGAEIAEKAFPTGKRLISGLAPRGGQCAIDIETKSGKVDNWQFVDAGAEWRDGLELAFWYLYSPSTPIASLHDEKPDTSLVKADGTRFRFTEPGEKGRDMAGELVEFIKSAYLGHGEPNHVSDESIFAGEVDYYDKGRLPRSAVAADHQSYYKKWPERRYELIADSLKLKAGAGNSVEATFRYAFQLQGSNKKTGGIGETTLTIEVQDGRFVIVRENGRVVSKN